MDLFFPTDKGSKYDAGGRDCSRFRPGTAATATARRTTAVQIHTAPKPVPVSFGGSGSVVQSNLITRQAANATGKSDEAVCKRAFINAAHKFQATAQSRNTNRVSNFHSYYNRKILRGGQYDCEVGTFHARVVMRGDIAR